MVLAAIERYRETVIPPRRRRDVTYDVKDVVGTGGFGIGSAGLPAYNVLLEGYDQALENDVVLSVKQGNVAAPSRIVAMRRSGRTSSTRATGRRSASARCRPTPPSSSGTPRSTASASSSPSSRPTRLDLDWEDLTEPEEIRPVLAQLGRATAKLHCVGDADSDHTLVPFQTEEAITTMIGDRREEFIADLVDFAHAYARRTQEDHRLFVDAFRAGADPRDQLERGPPGHRIGSSMIIPRAARSGLVVLAR